MIQGRIRVGIPRTRTDINETRGKIETDEKGRRINEMANKHEIGKDSQKGNENGMRKIMRMEIKMINRGKME